MPLFSIITICYNAAETIERTLESVDCQTFGDYEHLIVDGASTDKTVDMVIARAIRRDEQRYRQYIRKIPDFS